MSLEIKSNQFLYNLIELTHRKKYSRVIRICDFLESQGISSHEFIIIKSYAIAHTKGYTEALTYLQPFEGLLISTAKIQYQQMLEMFGQSEYHFDTLTTNQGVSVLEMLRQNNQILKGTLEKNAKEIIGENCKNSRFIMNKKQEEIVEKINFISNDYQEKKKLLSLEIIEKKEMIEHCQEFVKSYREISTSYRLKGKLKDLVEQYIDYLTDFIDRTI